MRSRYTAYARGLEEYVLATWHPATRPEAVPMDPELEWVRLEVLETAGGGADGSTGEVEFTAHYRERGRADRLHERSRFVRRGGRWFYLDGTVD